MADEYLTAALYGMKRFNEGASKKVKELMGMEKLIELLNEYENRDLELEEGEESNARTENNGHLWFNGANKVQFDTYMFDSLALSKKYGFIKWLVENKKIDRVEVWSEGKTKPTYGYTTEPYTTCKSIELENTILMVLAIQDEPIEFLVSILK